MGLPVVCIQPVFECVGLTVLLALSAASRAGHELMEFMKRNEIKPFRNFLVPLAQVSMFSDVMSVLGRRFRT